MPERDFIGLPIATPDDGRLHADRGNHAAPWQRSMKEPLTCSSSASSTGRRCASRTAFASAYAAGADG